MADEFWVRIDWRNSASGKSSEAADECALPAEIVAGHKFVRTDFPETYGFDDYDAARAFLKAVEKWEPRIPLIRDGVIKYDEHGDRIWWLATVTHDILDIHNPNPHLLNDDEPPIIEDPNIDLGRE